MFIKFCFIIAFWGKRMRLPAPGQLEKGTAQLFVTSPKNLPAPKINQLKKTSFVDAGQRAKLALDSAPHENVVSVVID
jgi:hypothetical protein